MDNKFERGENGLYPFQSHGTEEDYKEPFYDVTTDKTYLKTSIVIEVCPGGNVRLDGDKYLYIPEGTKIQRFTRGAEARYNKEKDCYEAIGVVENLEL